MKSIFYILLISLIIFQAGNLLGQENKIYVWDFTDRDGQSSELSINLTEEFEEALQSIECCRILQRRNYARLFAQRKNETAIHNFQSLPNEDRDRLKDLEANMVVFGELYDDNNSGQFKISVSIENFEGEILKSASTYMVKYDIHNPKKREEAITEIIDKLKFVPSVTRRIETKEVDEWTFSLTGCDRIGKDVKCGYVVTSNYRDRMLQMKGGTRAFDEYGYEYELSSQQLANKSSRSTINSLLIDGVPTSGFVIFENISSRANQFPLLEFKVKGDDLSENTFQFRNVEFE